MAFPAYREQDVVKVAVGDEFFLYTTRSCFHNPTRDRGRIIGGARATSTVRRLRNPRVVAGRAFELECGLDLDGLIPVGAGIELAPLVNDLDTFPNKVAWAARLRRPLVTLESRDHKLLRGLVDKLAKPAVEVVPDYIRLAERGRMPRADAQDAVVAPGWRTRQRQ